MKKSYDYFKKLKEMSSAVGEAYKNMLYTNEFNKEIITFSGLKWELSNNLLNEFVTPIERGDIYNLAATLGEELYFISKLNNIIALVSVNEFAFAESISSVFKTQTHIFTKLPGNKNAHKTLKEINEAKATLNGVNASIILSVKECLKTANQPLLKYAVVSGFFDVYKSIDTTFSELQKTIINNN